MAIDVRVQLNSVLFAVKETLAHQAELISFGVSNYNSKSNVVANEACLFAKPKRFQVTGANNLLNASTQPSPGIYIFLVARKVAVYSHKFNSLKNGAKLKSKFQARKNFEPGDILYIGKANDLVARINLHIYNDTTTYSLKLNHSCRKHLYGHIEVVYFKLKRTYWQHAGIILPEIERYLHKRLNPMIGSAKSS